MSLSKDKLHAAVNPSAEPEVGLADGGTIQASSGVLRALEHAIPEPVTIPDSTLDGFATLLKRAKAGEDISAPASALPTVPPHADAPSPDDFARSWNVMRANMAKGGVPPPHETVAYEEPTEPSGEEKQKAVIQALKDGAIKLDDGGVVSNNTQALPADAPQESKLQTILNALGSMGSGFKNAFFPPASPDPSSAPVMGPQMPMSLPPGMAGGATPDIKLNPLGTDPSGDFAVANGNGTLTSPPSVPPAMPAMPAALPLPAVPTRPATHTTPSSGAAVVTPSVSPSALANIFNQDPTAATQGTNPADRQALFDQLQGQQHNWKNVLGEALAGLGDAVAAKGGVKQEDLQNLFKLQTQQRQEALANFDAKRQANLQNFATKTQMGDNALKQIAAQDQYGVDDHLNGLVGAPKGTMKKDLPMYFQMQSAEITAQQKDEQLKLDAAKQASEEMDNAIKNSGTLGPFKPSVSQIQNMAASRADTLYNTAKGNVKVQTSDGTQYWLPQNRLAVGMKAHPGLKLVQ